MIVQVKWKKKYKKLAFFVQSYISHYFEDDTRYGQLQWKTNRSSHANYCIVPFPVTRNLGFKVAILFNK